MLVHGAWANSASREGETRRFEAEGYTVYVPVNPLRALTGDTATIADFVNQIKGPVVLVSHSCGGAMITNATRDLSNVKALVYVDAFEIANGEGALRPGPVARRVEEGFAAPRAEAVLPHNVRQRPGAEASGCRRGPQAPAAMRAIGELSGAPAWKTVPSWYVVGTIDKAAGSVD